ncbi:pyrroline-5-carboxylate reductase [Flavobacteriaceae bacterium Ap0902]|nr:pyrroline-5-carboxylate reductase [Flavobacteriaceae bacterium Ap0902]
MNKIAVLGTGNMGKAIIKGLLQNKVYPPSEIYATRRNLNQIQDLKSLGIHTSTDNRKVVSDSKWIIIAVKPHIASTLLEEIKSDITSNHVIISIVTGFSIASIRDIIGINASIYRAMPNTATSIQEGITCIAGERSNPEILGKVQEIFQQLGETILIEEKLMDAATVIGACGVAYALRFMRAMMQGAIEIGFDAETASNIVSQMVKGSATMLIENGLHPEQEIDKVTTPMGCTIAGLNEMEHRGFSAALIKGIKTSYHKIEK